jgi:hypothetical protein
LKKVSGHLALLQKIENKNYLWQRVEWGNEKCAKTEYSAFLYKKVKLFYTNFLKISRSIA